MLARSVFNMSVIELKKRSHLIVRILPETLSGAGVAPAFDFVELCGSNLAAEVPFGTNTREGDKVRKFATCSFNSLSQALLCCASRVPLKRDSHSLLTRVLAQSLLCPTSKAIFTCSLSSQSAQLPHSITALKFCSKIREAILKRAIKRKGSSKKQKKVRTSRTPTRSKMDMTVQMIFQIENELSLLKLRVAQEGCNDQNDPLIVQFAQLLHKYEDRVTLFKDHFMGENGINIQCEGVTFEQDVLEIEKMKGDLVHLRRELDSVPQSQYPYSVSIETQNHCGVSSASKPTHRNTYDEYGSQQRSARKNPTFGEPTDQILLLPEDSVPTTFRSERPVVPVPPEYNSAGRDKSGDSRKTITSNEQTNNNFSLLVNQMRAKIASDEKR